MKDTQNEQLFTEISTEESATVNGGGGCIPYTPYWYRRSSYRRFRQPYYQQKQTVNVYFNNPSYY
ncbi:MAG: hypothetical protein F6K31_22350 [Symploca sp. SIO2G7]|nr:hypothetical protein [Symploca sp. SIO2G7]